MTASTASVNDVDTVLEQVSIYPNPAKNSIRLKNSSDLNVSSIKITNMIGKEVFTSKFTKPEIEISNLNSGIYILTIQSENKSKNIKFIKK